MSFSFRPLFLHSVVSIPLILVKFKLYKGQYGVKKKEQKHFSQRCGVWKRDIKKKKKKRPDLF